jgi:hypothetical protein
LVAIRSPNSARAAVSVSASGICVQPAPCGGLGQRACCTGTNETAISGQLATCNDGLTTVPGCSGEVWTSHSHGREQVWRGSLTAH